ncbi:MAG: SDR family oxidoreductase [Alicyclobacillus sp.]|nr:SDR family oxidoreductase [Alicyclobacillus sp.]
MYTHECPLGLLHGRTALVTGGASGIGKASALALAGQGVTVAICDRNREGMARAAAEITRLGGRAETFYIDFSDLVSIPGMVKEVTRVIGGVDILINCAGILQQTTSLLDMTEEEWEQVYRVNVTAPFILIREVARDMIRRGVPGRIVNVTSAAAFRAADTPIAYASSKAALTAITRSAAAELAKFDINVNAVAPGVTATPIHGEGTDDEDLKRKVSLGATANLLKRVSRPEDVAAAVLFLCLPGSRQITAQTVHVSAGAIV